MTDELTPAQLIQQIADTAGLTLAATFVPFSLSRNAKPRHGEASPWKSLNWRITLQQHGRDVLTTDYGQGIAYCPSSGAGHPWSENRHCKARAVDIEIETGKAAVASRRDIEPMEGRKPIAPPSIVDVLWSLALDASALDYASFESWAEDYGADTDSRQAEADYRIMLSHALALRAALGEAVLSSLRDAAQEL